jgi:hypothetical protein
VVIWGMRGQFMGIDVFENLKLFVIFWGYDSLDIGFVVTWLLQGSIDFIEG